MSKFNQKLLKGMKWSFLSKILFQLSNFLFAVILARLLAPGDFGVFAMITVFSAFALLFNDLGLGKSLIFFQDVGSKEYDTAFITNIIIGLLISFLFFFAAKPISLFYEEPRLILLIRIFSVSFLIRAIGIVNLAIIKKDINFKMLGIIENTSSTVGSIAAILLAYFDFGVISLVIKVLIAASISTAMAFVFSGYRPTYYFNFEILKKLWGFGLKSSMNTMITYWMRNFDNLMIGKVLGNGPLGVYNMAYQIMLLPLKNITRVIATVLFPSFSQIQNDKEKIKRIYLKVIQTIALITFPALAGLSVLSNEFILSILGDKWVEMNSYLPILALIAIPQSIFTLNGSVYQSIGKPQIPLILNLISLPFYLLGFYFGLKWNGIIGLIQVYAALTAIFLIPIYVLLSRQIRLKLREFMAHLFPIFLSTFVMCVVGYFMKAFLQLNDSYVSSLLSYVIVMVLVYVLQIFFFWRRRVHLFDHLS